MKKYLLLGIFCCLSLTVQGQNTWLGVNTNWNDGANWTAGIPTSASYVRINSSPSNFPVLTGNVTVHRCEMNGGTLSLGSYELKSDSSYILLSTINSTGGKFTTTEAVRFGRNTISGTVTLEIDKGYLYGNIFNDAVTLIANAPSGGSDAVIVGWIRPDTFKGETTFINKGPQNGMIVGVQADGGFDTTVFEQKFTFRNESTVANATSVFGNGEYSASSKVLFKGEVVLEGTHTGLNQPLLSFINAEFRQPVTVKMRGGTIRFGVTQLYTRSVVFQSSLLLDTPGTTVEFGDGFTSARMGAAGTISVASGQMTGGELRFYKYRSMTTTPQLIQLSGSGTDSTYATRILTTDSTDFAGAVYLRADRVQLDGGRFAGQTTVEQLGASSVARAMGGIINSVTTLNAGGNRFLDSLIVINRRSGVWQWENSRQDTHGKGIRLTHAALGSGWVSIANKDAVYLPHLRVNSSVDAGINGGVRIGYGADSVIVAANKIFSVEGFARGLLELYRFLRKGSQHVQSITLGQQAGIRIDESKFEPLLTLTASSFELVSSLFLQASTFNKTADVPDSWIDNSLFYDLAVFANLVPSGSTYFGPRDSEVISAATVGSDSLRRMDDIDPTENIDWHPNRIILQSDFEVLSNARYSAVIEPTQNPLKVIGNEIVPPSPEAAALGRYGELPVSLSNGTASFEIPLYEVTSGVLKVPVKLTYHSSGVKVNDIATSVGTGWALQAGGAITRIVKGLRDECERGILHQFIPEQSNTGDFYCYIGKLTTGNDYVDNMPDDFFYNFNGYSGEFLYHSRNASNQNITPIPLTYPHSTLKIDWVDQVNFAIMDVDGTVYEFQALETSRLQTNSARLNPCGVDYTSAWYITRIISPNKVDVINFTYTSVAQVQEQPLWSTTLREQINSFSNRTYTYSYDFQKTTVNTVLLSEINYKNGKVTFSYSTDRQDRTDANAKRLNTVAIYKKESNESFTELKHFTLGHSYFTCTDGNSQVDHPLSQGSHMGSPLLKRLRLDSVTEYAPGNSSSLPPYSFEYYGEAEGEHPLPIYGALAQDYWGYSNGAAGNTNLLLWNTDPTKTQIPSSVYGADCTPDFAYAVSGALKKITYPTQGSSELEYEANKMTTGEEGGSIRIKKIVHNDRNNAPTQVSYNYTQPYYTNSVFQGSVSSQLYVYTTKIWVDETPSVPDCFWVFNDITLYPDKTSFSLGSEATFIAYEKVEEYREDGLGNRLGKKKYTYTTSVDQAMANFLQELVSAKWKRGLLLEEKTFSILPSPSNEEKLIKKQETTYTELVQPFKTRGVMARLTFDDDSNRPPSDICPMSIPRYCDIYSHSNTYVIEEKPEQSSVLLPNQTTTTTYDQNGLNEVEDVITYEYSSVHLQLTKQTTSRSDGVSLETTYKYPHDFTTQATYNEMVNRHIWSPVIETQLKENNTLIQSGKTNYKQWHSGTNYEGVAGFFAPFSVETQEYGGPVQTLVKMGETLDTPTQDGFDTRARPILYTERNGITTELEWYETSGKKDKLKKKTTHGQSVEYNYEEGIGLKSVTAPNGLMTHYSYDEFQRLKLIKDHNSNITDRFLYTYAESPTDKNRVTQQKLRIATTNENDANAYTNALINHQYLDGLGRPLQRVGQQQSPGANDLVIEATEYDKYGRIIKQTAPTPVGQSTGNYVADVATGAESFYDDTAPYQETKYEKSTLNRPLQTIGLGEAWHNADKKTEIFYETAGSDIPRYYLDGSNNVILSNSNFPANSLFKKRVRDEQENTTIEITDKQGRLVQKQQYDGADYLTTYYVYDGLDRVRAVIQPKGYALAQSFNYDTDGWDKWVFSYKYDNLGRLIEKKVPGAGKEFYVYDKWDKLVWKQNALQNQTNRWTFFKYDILNREIARGETNESSGQNTLQAAADSWSGSRYENRTSTDVFYSLNNSYPAIANSDSIREVFFYDNYTDWRPSGMNFEDGGGSAYHSQIGSTMGMATGGLRRNNENWNMLANALYYDDKNRLIQQFSHNLYNRVERTDIEYKFSGEVLKTRHYHKDQNGTTTTQLTENEYDHAGRPITLHQTINSGTGEKLAAYSYDGIGRMSQKKIMPDGMYSAGGIPATIIHPPNPGNNTTDQATQYIRLKPGTTITAGGSNTYLAQITAASGGISIVGLQTIDYKYHIRGGLLGINLDGSGNPTPNSSQGDLFSYKLEYETAAYWDGNIGKQSWQNIKNNSATGVRRYTYTYDGASRLKSADYVYEVPNGENFSLPAINYDENGNITNLRRKGKNGSSFGDIDHLTYYYSGNRLTGVTDAVTGNEDVGDFKDNGSNSDYTYWNDGSLKSDGNKGIDYILYDSYLQRVKQVKLTNDSDGTVRWLKFFYDGGGTLLKRTNSLGDVWEYTAGTIYKNSVPYQMSMPEGRVTYTNSNWVNEFEYRDHQNNLRVAFKDFNGQLSQTQTSETDPFGLEIRPFSITDINEQNYRFQNQEKIDDFGLNLNWFKYRPFDPQIGRGWQVDRLADQYVHNSPYAFSENKVTGHIELDGLEAVKPSNSKQNNGYFDKLYQSIIKAIPEDFKIESIYTVGPQIGFSINSPATSIGVDFSPASIEFASHSVAKKDNSLVEKTKLGYIEKTETRAVNGSTTTQTENVGEVKLENKIGAVLGAGKLAYGREVGMSQNIRIGAEGSSDFRKYSTKIYQLGNASVESKREYKYGQYFNTNTETNFFKVELKFLLGIEIKVGFETDKNTKPQ